MVSKSPRYIVGKRKYSDPIPVEIPVAGFMYLIEHKRQGKLSFYVDQVNDDRWLVGQICSESGSKIPTTIDIKQVNKITQVG